MGAQDGFYSKLYKVLAGMQFTEAVHAQGKRGRCAKVDKHNPKQFRTAVHHTSRNRLHFLGLAEICQAKIPLI